MPWCHWSPSCRWLLASIISGNRGLGTGVVLMTHRCWQRCGPHTHNRFTALWVLSVTPGWAGTRRNKALKANTIPYVELENKELQCYKKPILCLLYIICITHTLHFCAIVTITNVTEKPTSTQQEDNNMNKDNHSMLYLHKTQQFFIAKE